MSTYGTSEVLLNTRGVISEIIQAHDSLSSSNNPVGSFINDTAFTTTIDGESVIVKPFENLQRIIDIMPDVEGGLGKQGLIDLIQRIQNLDEYAANKNKREMFYLIFGDQGFNLEFDESGEISYMKLMQALLGRSPKGISVDTRREILNWCEDISEKTNKCK